MPRGHKPKREAKKPRKKAEKPVLVSPPEFAPAEVEVVKKRRKPREEQL